VAALKEAASNIEQRKALLLDLQCTLWLEVAAGVLQVLRAQRMGRRAGVFGQGAERRVEDITHRSPPGWPATWRSSRPRAGRSIRGGLLHAQAQAVNGRATLGFLIGRARSPAIWWTNWTCRAAPLEKWQAWAGPTARTSPPPSPAWASPSRTSPRPWSSITRRSPSTSTSTARETFPPQRSGIACCRPTCPSSAAADRGRRPHGLVATAAGAAQSIAGAAADFGGRGHRLREPHHRAKVLDELRTQVAAAKEGYRQADQDYRAGTATSLEPLIAQDQVLSAELQLASQEFEYKVAYLTLCASPAGSNQPPAADHHHAQYDASSEPPQCRPPNPPACQWHASTEPASISGRQNVGCANRFGLHTESGKQSEDCVCKSRTIAHPTDLVGSSVIVPG